MELQNAAEKLNKGEIGIIPTDTLYGLVARATDQVAVKNIYTLKERDPEKAVIILVADIADLKIFDVELSKKAEEFTEKYWPGKISIILPCRSQKFGHLSRGLESLAFRVPDNEDLRALLRQTGPLIAPSANREGEKPATTITEAQMYFGGEVDFYVDGGELSSEPSTLVSLLGEGPEVLRQGAIEVV